MWSPLGDEVLSNFEIALFYLWNNFSRAALSLLEKSNGLDLAL
jgi:hypothetical protein